jgi:ELWxxDGT repeat protein
MANNTGNNFRTPQELDLNYGRFIRVSSRLNQNNQTDIYRFKLKPRSGITISVTGNRRAPNFRLLDANRELVDRPQLFSAAANNRTLQRTSLRKGNYFIKVTHSGQNTAYQMNVGAFRREDLRPPRNDPDGGGGPRNDLAPNRPQNGRPIPARPIPQTYSDFVGPQDRVDFYQFELRERRTVQAILFNIRNRASVALLDEDLNVVAAARDRGTNPRQINVRVPKGQYYLRVRPLKNKTRYSLTVSATPRIQPGSQPINGGQTREFTAAQIADIFPGSNSSLEEFIPDSSRPNTFAAVGDTLFFAADNGISGTELWRSDGTAAGTQLVRDINPGPASSNPSDLVNVGGVLYFAADDGVRGRELWRSDGTANGTRLAFDINPGRASSNPADLVGFNGRVYFAADNGVAGRELISFNPANNRITVLDIRPGRNSSNPTDLTVSGNRLFFAAENVPVLGRELWVSDGTLGGTQIIDINRSPNQSSNPSDLVDVNGTLYFAADDGIAGRELWQSDGSTNIGAGTRLAADINPGRPGSDPSFLVNVNGIVYFAATDGTVVGRELYRYDPSTQQASLVADINPTSNAGSEPTDLANFNGTLIFAATDGTVVGREVYVSDGTAGTTRLAASINNTPNEGSNPAQFTVIGNTVFFAANDGVSGRELWGLTRTR